MAIELVKNVTTLKGEYVTLEPVQESHVELLEKHYLSEFSKNYPIRYERARDFYNDVAVKQTYGPVQLFTVFLNSTGEAVGCSGYLYYDPSHKRVEVGATWLGLAVQGTMVNSEVRLLLFDYAFTTLGCNRVQVQVDSQNSKNISGLTKLGLTHEGTFRNHVIMPDGRLRHSAFFSVIAEEWPRVKQQIAARIGAKTRAAA